MKQFKLVLYFFWISIKVLTAIKQLLNKPYVNEVILRGQNLTLKCCQPLKLWTYFEKKVRSFHTDNVKCVGQKAAKLLSLKLWEWCRSKRSPTWAEYTCTYFPYIQFPALTYVRSLTCLSLFREFDFAISKQTDVGKVCIHQKKALYQFFDRSFETEWIFAMEAPNEI